MVPFPASAADITTEWMNEALTAGGHLGNHNVVSCEAHDSDVPGQTAEIVQISVAYDSPACALPKRFIAKITSRNPVVIDQVIRVYDLYRREVAFYAEFQDPGISVPDCYVCEHDPEAQRMIILLADLIPAESPSWVPAPDQTELALSYLPAFHAKWWNDPLLRTRDWFVQFDDHDFFSAAAAAANTAKPLLEVHFGNQAQCTAELMTLWQANLDKVMGFVASRPFTFVHGDYHPKQMFFPASEGGKFAVIDWQFPFVGQGAWDFTRMMVLGLDVETRRARQADLIAGYYGALIANGVENYAMEDLEKDIKIGLIVSQMIMMIALVDTDVALIEKECAALGVDWRDVMILRGETAVRDWGVIDFVKSLSQTR